MIFKDRGGMRKSMVWFRVGALEINQLQDERFGTVKRLNGKVITII